MLAKPEDFDAQTSLDDELQNSIVLKDVTLQATYQHLLEQFSSVICPKFRFIDLLSCF